MYIYHYSPTIVSCKIYGNIKFSTRIQKNNHKTVNYIIKHIKYEIIYRNKIRIYRLYLDIINTLHNYMNTPLFVPCRKY